MAARSQQIDPSGEVGEQLVQLPGITDPDLGQGRPVGGERVGEVGAGQLGQRGSSSTPTARRPKAAASTRVVPIPHMGSTTSPLGGQYSAISWRASSGSILPGWRLEAGR